MYELVRDRPRRIADQHMQLRPAQPYRRDAGEPTAGYAAAKKGIRIQIHMNSPGNLNVGHLLQQGVAVLEFSDEKPYASLRMRVRIMVDDEAVGDHPLVKLLFELTVSRVDTKGNGIQVDEAHPERRAQDG